MRSVNWTVFRKNKCETWKRHVDITRLDYNIALCARTRADNGLPYQLSSQTSPRRSRQKEICILQPYNKDTLA